MHAQTYHGQKTAKGNEVNYIKAVLTSIGLMSGLLSAATHAQNSGELRTELGTLDEWQGGAYSANAARNGEYLLEALRREGADTNIIRLEECRVARNYSLAGLYDKAQESMELALADLADFFPHTQVNCRIDQAIHLRLSAQNKLALTTATKALADAQTIAPDEPLLHAKAATELALTLLAERRFDEAKALHQRAAGLAGDAGEEGLAIELRNQIALVDIALQNGEIATLPPIVDDLLNKSADRFGETSLWTAEILERMGGIEVRRNNLARGGRILNLVSSIRTPDPVGLVIDEYRAFQVGEIVRQRIEMSAGGPVEDMYFTGNGFSPLMALRYQLELTHPDRIEVAVQHTAASIAVVRHRNLGNEGTPLIGIEGAIEAHHASREALAGLITRIKTAGVERALPDRFNPLGRLSLADVVFNHVDALWFDTYERDR